MGWGPNIDTKGSLVGIILEIRASNDYPDSEFPSNIHVKFGDQMVPSKRIPGPAPFIAPDDPLNIVTIVTLIAPVPEAPETEDEFTNKQVPVNLVVFGPVEFHVHCGIFTYTDKVVNEGNLHALKTWFSVSCICRILVLFDFILNSNLVKC